MQNEGLSGEEVEEVMRINLDLPEAEGKKVKRCHRSEQAKVCWPFSPIYWRIALCSENVQPLTP